MVGTSAKATAGGTTSVSVSESDYLSHFNSVFPRTFKINDNLDTSSREYPQLATYSNTLYAVWADNRNATSGLDIYFAKSFDGGETWSANVGIVQSESDQRNPVIATGPNGQIYVAYDNMNDIFFLTSSDGGNNWSQPLKVTDDPHFYTDQIDPSIAVDTDGTIYLAWTDYRNGDVPGCCIVSSDIYWAKSSNGGISFSANTQLSTQYGWEFYPQIKAVNGYIFLVWLGSDNNKSKLFFVKSADHGNTFSSPVTVTDSNAVPQNPALFVDANTNIYVSWDDSRISGLDQRIYFAKSVDGGNTFGPNILITTNYKAYRQSSLAVDLWGTIHVVWEAQDTSPGINIYYSVSQDGGATFKLVRRVNDNIISRSATQPSLVLDSKGIGYVVWSQASESGSNIIYDIYSGQVSIVPHLDLPIQYTNFSIAANGNYGGNNSGLVNSWFDHNPTAQTVTTWTGNTYTGYAATSPYTCNRVSCYDGHNGIDFRNTENNELVYAAANGTIFGVVNNCQNSIDGCTGYGNRVWIDHHNGYATLYGHLSLVSVTDGTDITDRLAQPLGVMGSTGNSTGIHLHFGLYYDKNDDGKWSESEAVDPYGYEGTNYLWLHQLSALQQIDSSGGYVTAPSGNSGVTVPVDAVSNPVTLELWDIPPVADASAALRSTGNSFLMQVLEWLTGGSSNSLTASSSTNSFDVPITVSVRYDPVSMPHLDLSQLTINQWNDASQAWMALSTTLNTVNHLATAQTTQPGYFDLQAPLVCPADTLEPNDYYDGASFVQTDGTLMASLFDIATDEDWFKFDGISRAEYTIQTTNLATGVDTILEVYDTDGVTLLGTDDNGGGGNASSLTWQAPADGTYFVRVTKAAGSAYGCDAGYEIGISAKYRIYLPLVIR
jgi:murein DD-endopeptidase MepM/ murein hydrolase activator NlpD